MDLWKKLNELEFDITSKMGSEYNGLKSCNYINIAGYDVDISMLNMTEVTHKRMEVYVLQYQAEDEWLVEHTTSQKGRYFNLAAGSLESTEHSMSTKCK
ncbi:hypothetical protein A6R68_13667, partial [Neotoma lepida]